MQALFAQAQSFHQSGQFQQAEASYRQLLLNQPNHPVLNARLGILLHQMHRSQEALELIARAIDGLPDEFELLMQGAGIASQLGENARAEPWLSKAVLLKPQDLAAHEQLAGVLIANHQEARALEVVKKAIKLDPKSANAYNLKGLALCRLGDIDKGYQCFQSALRLNPGQLGVIRNLILYGKNKKEPLLEQLMPQLEQRLSLKSQPNESNNNVVQMNLAYILSMYYEQHKEPGKTFHYLKLGNDLNRAGYRYQHRETQQQFGLLANTFNEQLKMAFAERGLNDDSAIFILGMPRSGTTLIEQILSSHSLVEAEGEIEDLKNNFAKSSLVDPSYRSMEELITASLQVAENYLSAVRRRQSARFFTDKMPYNFMLVGLIALALPKAKIIHCTRDPLETCFSIYKQNFSGSHSYSNELTELGQYYNLYRSLMAHWDKLFGARIYQANYEKMVDDSEQEIGRLLTFCGLEMEPRCLDFHKNKRAVRTASVAQVRQPIYRDAMKASAPYQKALAPLISVLANGAGGELL